MRKILIFLMAIVLCAGCKNYQADIDDYLSYWSTEAAIVRYNFDPAITVPTDKESMPSIPSASDVIVTFIVRNPKNFNFKLPGQPASPSDITVFRTGVGGSGGTNSPEQPTDYELIQDSNSKMTLKYKAAFLQKHEYGQSNIGPTITLYADNGRKFQETFTLNVKANTPPPNLTYRAIGKTAAPDGNGKQYYVLFLEAKGMDTEINGSVLLHKDVAQFSIAEGGGSYASIPLTVKADKSGFDISGAGGRLLEAGETTELLPAEITAGSLPDSLPSGKWILRIKTDVPVGGATKQYRFRLGDEAGLYSADELKTSTNTNKVKSVEIIVTSGTWSVTPKSGTNADPHEIAYQSSTGKILLQAKTATFGAMVYYKVERNGSTVNESSGTTPVTIELPAVPDAVYKLTAWAVKEGFENSPEEVVCYKTKRSNRLEISAGTDAWRQLKAAVAAAEDGDIFLVNGSIQATNDAGNSGAIEVTKSITIKGKSGNANTDMLDANQSGLGVGVHRIFNVNSGTLTLENLTLKNGKAAGGGEARNGGAMLIESGGTLTMTGCVVQECTAAANGGGILNKGTLTINHGRIESNEANAGGGIYNTGTLTIHTGSISANTATNNGGGIYNEGTLIINNGIIGKGTSGNANHATNSGGGIFLYQGACMLNDTKIQENTIGSGKGSGIYLYQPNGAALTITGGTQIGSSTDINTLCLGAQSSQSAFVTAKDLNSTAHINMEPQVYFGQKNKTLVKVPAGASAAAYKVYFHLTSVLATEIWELVPDSQNEALILKQAEVINNSGNSWKRLKTAVEGAGEGDIIIVNGTIQATSASDNFGDITVSKSITIRGKNGNPATDILDANKDTGGKSAHRIFNVTGGNLTMEGLTLTGGMAIASGVGTNIGGGIYVGVNSRAELKNCIITACKAARVGGGIYSEGELILDNCTIGGEQYYDGMDPAKPKGNTALSGGGVSSNQGNLTIIGGAITYNTADGPGGGIAFGSNDRTATLKVTGTDISHNKAKETGGGIYLSAPGYSEKYVNATLQNVTVKNNELTSTDVNDWRKGGGGIFFTNHTNGATLTIIGGSIEGNNARNFNGGGIYITTERDNYVNGTLTLKDGARISGNTATNGGGIAVRGSKLFMEGNTTTVGGSGTDQNTAADHGGGVYVQKGIFTMSGGKITGNQARRGGGVSGGDKAEIVVKGSSEISENTATINGTLAGGGIDASYKLIVTDTAQIKQNHAPSGFGGGIACGNDTRFDFSGGTVTGNTAGYYGKGVYISPFSQDTYLQMSGSAQVETNNDMFLSGSTDSEYAYITVTGALKQASTAKLTMNNSSGYSVGRAVVKGDGGYTLTAEDTGRFTVTPGGSPSQNWYIDSNGKLTTTQP